MAISRNSPNKKPHNNTDNTEIKVETPPSSAQITPQPIQIMTEEARKSKKSKKLKTQPSKKWEDFFKTAKKPEYIDAVSFDKTKKVHLKYFDTAYIGTATDVDALSVDLISMGKLEIKKSNNQILVSDSLKESNNQILVSDSLKENQALIGIAKIVDQSNQPVNLIFKQKIEKTNSTTTYTVECFIQDEAELTGSLLVDWAIRTWLIAYENVSENLRAQLPMQLTGMTDDQKNMLAAICELMGYQKPLDFQTQKEIELNNHKEKFFTQINDWANHSTAQKLLSADELKKIKIVTKKIPVLPTELVLPDSKSDELLTAPSHSKEIAAQKKLFFKEAEKIKPLFEAFEAIENKAALYVEHYKNKLDEEEKRLIKQFPYLEQYKINNENDEKQEFQEDKPEIAAYINIKNAKKNIDNLYRTHQNNQDFLLTPLKNAAKFFQGNKRQQSNLYETMQKSKTPLTIDKINSWKSDFEKAIQKTEDFINKLNELATKNELSSPESPTESSSIFQKMKHHTWLAIKQGNTGFVRERLSPPKEEEKEEVAVYFIHGTGDGPGAMDDLATNIMHHSILDSRITEGVVVAFEGRFQGKNIQHFADQLSKQIRANGHKKVILVGHSRGGLVAAEFARNFSEGIEIAGITTLCTPFGGAKMIDHPMVKPLMSISGSVEQMHKESGYLKSLNKEMTQTLQPHVLNWKFYAADKDSIVDAKDAYPKTKEAGAPLGTPEIIKNNEHQTILVDESMPSKMVKDFNDFLNPKPEIKSESHFFEQMKSRKFREEWEEVERPHLISELILAYKTAENLNHKISLAKNLIVLLKSNYQNTTQDILFLNEEIFKLQTQASQQKENIEEKGQEEKYAVKKDNTIKKVVINFCGTGCPPFLAGSAHDDFYLKTLKENPYCVGINIPGVGFDDSGHLNNQHVINGSGMADRVARAAKELRALQSKGQLDDNVEIVVLGHSRGAVEALTFGKLLNQLQLPANKKCLTIAHDPVVGGKDKDPNCLKEEVRINDESIHISTSMKDLLNKDEEIPGNLKVILRTHETRSNAFSLLEAENAYKANHREIISEPGYHNVGVLNAKSANLDTIVAFKWATWFLNLRSHSANQSLKEGRIDANRDKMKTYFYERYTRMLNDFSQDLTVHESKIEPIAGNYSVGALSNPTYHGFRDETIREIPPFLQKNLNNPNGAQYALQNLLEQLTSEEKGEFLDLINLANDKNFRVFSKKINEYPPEKLLKLYQLIEESLKTPGFFKEKEEKEEDTDLMQALRLLAKERHWGRSEYGKTQRWQRSLKYIKDALSLQFDTLPDSVLKENIRAVLSSHRGRSNIPFAVTESISKLVKKEKTIPTTTSNHFDTFFGFSFNNKEKSTSPQPVSPPKKGFKIIKNS